MINFSDIFKGCTHLTTLPSIEDMMNNMLYHTDNKTGYVTYQGNYIQGEKIDTLIHALEEVAISDEYYHENEKHIHNKVVLALKS